MTTKEAKELLKKKNKIEPVRHYLSTGSTLLNLACSDKPLGGFRQGLYYWITGDSQSGKTFLSLTCVAEACRSKHFESYRLLYDNSEDGCLMDVKKFFGEKVMKRLEPPEKDKEGNSVYSSTIEDFYYHLDDAKEDGRPFIYILDSMDSLSSKSEMQKFQEQKKAYRKGNKVAGSYGDGKAKQNSEYLRQQIAYLHKTGSILIIVSQNRSNLSFGFETKTQSGGHALKYYATLQLSSAVKGKIKKSVKGKNRVIGNECVVKIKKNRISGKDRTIILPIYPSFGIDDLGSCIDFLCEENYWKKEKGGIFAKEFDIRGDRETIIKHIEEKNLEKDLSLLVGEVWNEIEDLCKVERKPRYL